MYPSALRLHFDGGRLGLFYFDGLAAIDGPTGIGPGSERGSPLIRLTTESLIDADVIQTATVYALRGHRLSLHEECAQTF